MLTRRVRIQVLVFVVLALLAMAYVGASYAGLGRLVGGYQVRLQLQEGSGLFTGGEVTYRGVPVGRVGELRLADSGIEVELDLESSAPPIPVDSVAVVANRSAVGEQYVDLQPRGEGGPFLRDGATIPRERSRTPLPVQTLLGNLNALTTSVPTGSLQTVVNELDDALRGAGPALQVLLDSTGSLTESAVQNLPQTTALIADGSTVLRTQAESSAQWRTFSSSARRFAEQLSASDGDLRKLIATAPGAATEISQLLRDTDPGLSVLVANLLTTAEIVDTRTDGLGQLLVTAPKAIAATSTAITPEGARFALPLTFYDPLPCRAGYGGTDYRASTDTSPAPFPTSAACTLPSGNASSVRGSQNAPRGSVPEPARPAGTTGVLDAPELRTSTSLEELLWPGT